MQGPGTTWTSEEDEEQYRRGVYMYWKRTFLHPSMLAFDAPTRQESEAKRSESNTPSQALVLLNDPTYVEAARVFAQRIMDEGGESVEARIQWAYREALSRDARPEELNLLTQLYSANKTEFAEDESLALQFVSTGNAPVADETPKTDLAAWTSVSRTIFNLHEMITRY